MTIATPAKHSGHTHDGSSGDTKIGGTKIGGTKMEQQKRCERPAEPRPAGEPSPRFKVSELLGKAREAILVHGGEEYRLRITSNGKLILTK